MLLLLSQPLTYIVLGFLGLVLGSFAGAQIWRLRARQLASDVVDGEPVDKAELKRLQPLLVKTARDDRSRCLHCHHQLHAIDLVPLLSWLSTSGRCRYCKVAIGWFEPAIELGMAAIFVVSFAVWPTELTTTIATVQFITWLVAVVALVILLVYDLKWFLLPDRVVFPLIAVSAIYASLTVAQADDIGSALFTTAGAIFVLSGIYYGLWLISKGRWIGFGDVKLGIALGLLTGSWQLALLALFLANFIGTLIVLPALLTKKMSRSTQVPFGPLLILGAVLTIWFGQPVIDWYLSTTSTLML